MRRLGISLTLLLLTGCTTTVGQQILAKTNLGADVLQALQDLKVQIQPIIGVVSQDALATRAWATSVLSPTGTNPDPVKYQLALACPTATDAVAGLINQTLDGLITQVQALETGGSTDPNAPQGRLMLFLTQLKYGPQGDPKAQLASLKAQFAVQMDALFTGCAHLFPKKQMNDLIVLMGKAGITGFTGGAAAPLLGILP